MFTAQQLRTVPKGDYRLVSQQGKPYREKKLELVTEDKGEKQIKTDILTLLDGYNKILAKQSDLTASKRDIIIGKFHKIKLLAQNKSWYYAHVWPHDQSGEITRQLRKETKEYAKESTTANGSK